MSEDKVTGAAHIIAAAGEREKFLHTSLAQAEQLARDIQGASSGGLSLAVVAPGGKVLGWHAAHEAAVRIYRGGEET